METNTFSDSDRTPHLCPASTPLGWRPNADRYQSGLVMVPEAAEKLHVAQLSVAHTHTHSHSGYTATTWKPFTSEILHKILLFLTQETLWCSVSCAHTHSTWSASQSSSCTNVSDIIYALRKAVSSVNTKPIITAEASHQISQWNQINVASCWLTPGLRAGGDRSVCVRVWGQFLICY